MVNKELDADPNFHHWMQWMLQNSEKLNKSCGEIKTIINHHYIIRITIVNHYYVYNYITIINHCCITITP